MTAAPVKPATEKLDPALVAPVVAFLAHRECPVSGEIYTVGAGHVARFFVGRTPGFYSPALSIEDVRDHLGEIRDETGYTVPGGPADRAGVKPGDIVQSVDEHWVINGELPPWALRSTSLRMPRSCSIPAMPSQRWMASAYVSVFVPSISICSTE